jgi:hypothetical protein
VIHHRTGKNSCRQPAKVVDANHGAWRTWRRARHVRAEEPGGTPASPHWSRRAAGRVTRRCVLRDLDIVIDRCERSSLARSLRWLRSRHGAPASPAASGDKHRTQG